MKLIDKIFGTHSERELKILKPTVDKILALQPEMQKLSDEQLREKTAIFKKRLANGETLDDILVEAFAVVREAAKRSIGLEHYPVQLYGGVVLHQGRISEQRTGEGKSVPVDTKIPTPTGWRKAGDIKIGDKLFGVDGKETEVLAVYPQGIIDTYEIIFEDGRTVKCGEEHLWEIVDSNNNKIVMNTKDIIEKYNDVSKLSVRTCEKVHYDGVNNNELNAYDIGMKANNLSFVPNEIKLGTIETREKFIDGVYEIYGVAGDNLAIVVANNDIRTDIKEILYSLGYYCEESNKTLRYYKSDKLGIVNIKKLNEQTEQVCFTVENLEHLFLVGDYVVTHNTLVTTTAAYLNALEGKGVHVVTVNDYLAKRDATEMGQVHKFLGLSVGIITHDLPPVIRKKMYEQDITYVTNSELGFDYLRDNMAVYKNQKVLRDLHYCIIDEVDSILIDEARTPLIISGQGNKSTDIYVKADRLAKQMERGEDIEDLSKLDILLGVENEETGDFIVNEKNKHITLTDRGITKVEQYFKIDNYADIENLEIQHAINIALKANNLMFKDKDYVVKNDEIMIVDEFTGRIMDGRRYSDGLHQAIEAKEGVTIKQESTTLATITYQNFFNKYKKKAGMTGTAMTEEQEFRDIYQLDVVAIPTNKPVQRIDADDAVFKTKREKLNAIVEEVCNAHAKGQPVLVGTITIDASEELSKLLTKKNIPHNVLNAKFHEKEAEIVKDAGRHGAVTIATNMAGRGTDIKLDDEAREAGGLYVIGTERHESRRIDNQLRGRSGRQGDPGKSKFYISLDDNLMRLFGGDKMLNTFNSLGIPEGEEIQHKMLSNAIESAQKRIESNHYAARKTVLDYDQVMNEQREIIYGERNKVISGDSMRSSIEQMFIDIVNNAFTTNFGEDVYEITDKEVLKSCLSDIRGVIRFNLKGIKLESLLGKDIEEVKEIIRGLVLDVYYNKEKELNNDEMFRELERVILLKIVDKHWMNHLEDMEQLKMGIGLQAYGQRDPKVEYKIQGYDMFDYMNNNIKEDMVRVISRLEFNEV